jgi:16S rRNA (cytosine1402-N4)-methyltransferase
LPGEPAPPEPTFTLPLKQPVVPSDAEIEQNRRARSAKLRFGERTSALARAIDEALMKLAVLPQQTGRGR